ncbi:MAG: threonine--tRNA ligase [Coriobacteriales bacterium]|jgi:threonyl-tRNA synthetase|nr:threonine--tRNA ligase [Coriobacteriales bacterium]
MATLTVTLPDGTTRDVPSNSTAADVAASIGPGLLKAALAARIDGRLCDLSAPVHDGAAVEIVTAKSSEALELLRHSAAHIMAEAVMELFPGAVFGVGPAIEDGFYYDIEIGRPVTPDDLVAIEERMRLITAEARPFTRRELSADEARAAMADQPLKLELIDELDELADGEVLSLYSQGGFTDLCRGPHLPDTSRLAAFKITKAAAAYWRGDAARQSLQRVYGTAWLTQRDLDDHLMRVEEAEKRDHRRLGRELGIYMTDASAGVGLPLYLPKGARVIRTLQEWLRRDLYARGYEEVITPHIYHAELWKISGHYTFYHDNMYFFHIDESDDKDGSRLSEYAVKPMNCPGHVLLYSSELRSYRDLPLRLFEFGTVYRHEMSGVVHGLLRARGFTQDDAHIFCRADQVLDEVVDVLGLFDHIMTTFDFSYTAEISTRPEKSIGEESKWEFATEQLKLACEKQGLAYEINEGDGAFYGPKIDIKVRDAIGRTWQCSTVQVDFNFPERFDLTYRTADNSTEQPWMLHRAAFGSLERFLGILIEHYAGALPAWLAPVQAAVIPIADRHNEYAESVAAALAAVRGRVEVFDQNEPMRAKIARAQHQKIPYMLVVGDKEEAASTVSLRDRFEGDQGSVALEEFVARIAALAL